MKAGKKGRQAIFHNSACLLFASLQPRSFGTEISHAAFFKEPEGEQQNTTI